MISKNLNNISTKLFRCYSSGNKKSLGVIGVPFSKGQRKDGTELGPKILRDSGLIKCLKNIDENFEIKDYGDISYTLEKNSSSLKNMRNYGDIIGCSRVLAQKVQDVMKENDQYLALGGDHSIGFGSIVGHLAHDPNLSVIWIDAHPDLNNNISSNSGNVHGMPVTMFLNELRNHYQNSDIEKIVKNYLPAKQLYYIGIRDIDPYESYLIKKFDIKAYGMEAIDKLGMPKIIEIILDSLDPRSNLHISLDIDSLEPSEAPSTGTKVLGGLTLRELFYGMEQFESTKRITGMDLVEINPLLGNKDDCERTVQAGIEATKIGFGYKRWKAPKDI